MKLSKYLIALIPLAAIALFDVASAQTFVPLADVKGSKLAQLYSDTGGLSSFVNNAFRFAVSIGAILAVLRLSYAGFKYMTNDSSVGSITRAKEIIGDVVLGLLLLLGVWLIFSQINPGILNLDALKELPQTPTKTTP